MPAIGTACVDAVGLHQGACRHAGPLEGADVGRVEEAHDVVHSLSGHQFVQIR